MNVSRWGVNNPVAAIIVFVVMCIAGLIGWRNLAISVLPDFKVPEITVNVTLPGAAPAQLETDVTRKIEDAVANLVAVDKVLSTITESRSATRIQFDLDRDMTLAIEQVRDAIDRIRVDLPLDIDEPEIARVNAIGSTLLSYVITTDRLAADELSWFIDDVVRKAMFEVPGMGEFFRVGGVDREVRVALRPDVLQAYGITAGTVSGQLARIQVELSGGRTTLGGGQQAVRTLAAVKTATELESFPIALPDGRSIRLSDIASVTDGIAEPKDIALLNGEEVVSFTVQRAKGTSEVEVGKRIRVAVDKLRAAHPEMTFTEVDSQVEASQNSYNASLVMLLEGAILAVIVVWFFLRDWRATWICAVALPLSVIPTFAVMSWFGFSLNLLSLLAFAVVIGILVDDAIVEVENIARHRAMGKSAEDAALDATDEIGLAVIATSVTLAAVFVPVAFIPGEVGLFFSEFGWTAATAVLCSLLVARLLTPMLASRYLGKMSTEHKDPKWMAGYLRWVEAALHHRGRTLLIALGIFIASLALIPLIPTTFLPAQDLTNTKLTMELAPGVSLDETAAVSEQARLRAMRVPDVDSIFTRVGAVTGAGYEGGFSSDSRKATLIIQFDPDTRKNVLELETEIRAEVTNIPGARFAFAGIGPGRKLDIVLAGQDPEPLLMAARNVEADVRSVPTLGSVSSSASLLEPQVLIIPDAARAADLGVATADIAEAARIATSGDFRQKLAKLNLPERQIPIRVQLAEEALEDVTQLGLLRVPSRNGSVPLNAVATISEGSGPAQIDRLNRERKISITAETNGQPVGLLLEQILVLPALKNLPAGVRFVPAGDVEALGELLIGFLSAILAGLASIYIVLLLLFRSGTQPLVILAAVPLCGAGAFGALLLSGYALSLPALVGLLTLSGIAVKNSILIVDYAILGERAGLNRHDALMDACRKRARPVIMTTVAMGAGMLPIALGLGADGSFRAPLGVTVIGGLLTSTLLSLIVVPAAYSLVAGLRDRWRGTKTQPVPAQVSR